MITNKKSNLNLGDIVVHASYIDATQPERNGGGSGGTLEEAPYYIFQNTPTMLIVEIQYDNSEKKVLYDTLLGNQVAERMKYKCIWFSQSHFEFTEEWFYESHLKSYAEFKGSTSKETEKPKKETEKLNENDSISDRIKNFKFSDSYQVTLKNHEIEKGKNISHFRNSYLPPFMTIIKVEKNDIQASQIYSLDLEGNRIQIKKTSTYKVKCKYYNPISNKFSEQWLIPEILQTH